MWHATLDTQHWRFDAYGATKQEAEDAMSRGLVEHAKQTDISPLQFLRDYDEGINYIEMELGRCYRDHDTDLEKAARERPRRPTRGSS